MTTTYVNGQYQIGVLTIAPSGSQTVSPLLCDSVFRNISITVAPMESFVDNRHSISLYIDGELSETHDYTTAGTKNITHMDYFHKLFPPNVNNPGIPAFFAAGKFDPGLNGFSVTITNLEDTARSYLMYSTFEAFESFKAKVLNFKA